MRTARIFPERWPPYTRRPRTRSLRRKSLRGSAPLGSIACDTPPTKHRRHTGSKARANSQVRRRGQIRCWRRWAPWAHPRRRRCTHMRRGRAATSADVKRRGVSEVAVADGRRFRALLNAVTAAANGLRVVWVPTTVQGAPGPVREAITSAGNVQAVIPAAPPRAAFCGNSDACPAWRDWIGGTLGQIGRAHV